MASASPLAILRLFGMGILSVANPLLWAAIVVTVNVTTLAEADLQGTAIGGGAPVVRSVVDQQNSQSISDSFFTVPSAGPVGQQFIPSYPGLDFVDIRAVSNDGQSVSALQVRIRKGSIFGPILRKANGSASGVSNASIRFNFSPTVPLIAGELYTLEVFGQLFPSDQGGGLRGVSYSSGTSYPFGMAIAAGSLVDTDLLFKEGVNTSAPTYPLRAITLGGGTVIPNSITGNYLSNALATVIAAPKPGWMFLGWQGDVAGTNSQIQVPIKGETTVEGFFGTSLSTSVSGVGIIRLDPMLLTYPYGTTVTATAIPELGFHFIGWSDAADNPRTIVVTNANQSLSAWFAPNLTPTNDSGGITVVTTIAGSGIIGNLDSANALEGRLFGPDGPSVGLDGTVYFADVQNSAIRFLTTTGDLGTLAGGSGVGYVNGVGTNARFSFPLGVRALASGNLLVADTENNVIREISLPAREVTTLSGFGARGYRDGTADSTLFSFPNDLVETPSGLIYVTEFLNHTVRRMARDGSTTTLAGNGMPGFRDGAGTTAQFNQPAGIAFGKDLRLYVTDWSNHRVRRITASGIVSTVAGTGDAGFRDGAASEAHFNAPNGISYLPGGYLFVTDTRNHAIRRIGPDGTVSTIAGSGVPGFADGEGRTARFNLPGGIALAHDGSLIVADTGNHRIRRVSFQSVRAPAVAIVQAETVGGPTPAFKLQIRGEQNQNVRLETSRDLRTWSPVKRGQLDVAGYFEVFGEVETGMVFYRATLGQ